MSGKPVLFMDVDGTLYPVAMTESQYSVFKTTVALLSPITIVKDQPQGQTVDLLGGDAS